MPQVEDDVRIVSPNSFHVYENSAKNIKQQTI